MQDIIDLNGGNGRTLKAAHQDPAQGVAQRKAKAALQRFGNHGCLTHRVVARFHVKLCRLDQFGPIFVDHVCLLNPCLLPMSEAGRRPRFK